MNNIVTAHNMLGAHTPVYLIKPLASRSWYGLHDMSRPTRPTTSLTVFCDEADARRWAHSMEAYRARHGNYPPREYTRLPKAFAWVQPVQQGRELGALDALEVVEKPFSDIMAMTLGSGVNCSIMLDIDSPRQKIEITHPFDRAAVCSRLNLVVSKDEHM